MGNGHLSARYLHFDIGRVPEKLYVQRRLVRKSRMLTATGYRHFLPWRDVETSVAIRLKNTFCPVTISKRVSCQIATGPEFGTANTSKSVFVTPSNIFRAERFFAADNAQPPGSGTIVKGIFVNARNYLSRPISTQTLTLSSNNFNNPPARIDMVVPAANPIRIDVEYVKDCTFVMTFFGDALR